MQSLDNPKFLLPPALGPDFLAIEKAILGVLILFSGNKEVRSEAERILPTPIYFYFPNHQKIYAAILSGSGLDILLLSQKLREMGVLDEVGGTPYLAELTGCVASSANFAHYCFVLREAYLRRRAFKMCYRTAEALIDHTKDVHFICEKAGNYLIESVGESLSVQGETLQTALKRTVDGIVQRATDLASGNIAKHFSVTPFPAMNYRFGGGWMTEVVVVAAQKGFGKSAFALQCLLKTGGMLISLEMGNSQILERAISHVGRIPSYRIRSGRLDPVKDFPAIERASQEISRSDIVMDDKPASDWDEIAAKITQAVIKHKIRIVYIDYLQLVLPPKGKKYGTRDIEIGEITRRAKQLSRDLGITLVWLCQLNRSADKQRRRPTASDLRESGNIENDADIVMILWSEDDPEVARKPENRDKPKNVICSFEKFRSGDPGSDLYYEFFGKYYEYREISQPPPNENVTSTFENDQNEYTTPF